jgi:CIC family chloride channel protein
LINELEYLNMDRFWQLTRWSLLIVAVGVIAGLGAVIFRDLIAFFHNLLFYGQFSIHYDVLQHAAPSNWGVGIIFVPVLGSLCVTYLVNNFAPEAKGPGVPEVMDAIYYERGKVRPIVAVIKSIASSISIGSGGSIGREGPIIQIGAAFGSVLGQWVKVTDKQRILMVACGAAGGIAATFNTPLGGILFATEIMLPEINARSIIPVSIATTIAMYTSYYFFSDVPFLPFSIGVFANMSVLNIISYIVISIIFGLASALFIRSIYFSEDIFNRVHSNDYIRHMLGMLLVGISMYLMIIIFGHYYIQGVGYATVQDVLTVVLDHPGLLILLAVLKLVATAITIGSGGSGGVFSPLLFIGATLGGCLAACLQFILPDAATITIPLGALAGMAAMVGASTGAPMTAVIMTAEMINNFNVILPLMLIVAVAFAIRRSIMRDSIYTLKLARRGHDIPNTLLDKLQSSKWQGS